MPAKHRKSTNDNVASGEVSFEDAISQLEAIVEGMENEQLPLNELIDQYEKGIGLFAICDKLLGQARERLELITLKAREQQAPQPSPSPQIESSDEDDPEDDDIRLF